LVSKKQSSVFQKFSTWIRGNLFIPDPRVFWVRPSVSFLHDFLIEKKITTIITTGPPHSIHLIGYRLKKKNSSLQWLADFRDPWSDWGLLDSLKTGTLARTIHKKLESKVLATADKIVTITPFYVRKFEALSKRKVSLITNGFDEDDFKSIEYKNPDKFTIRHVGIVNEKCDPRPFMHAVEHMMLQDVDFGSSVAIDFVGEVNPHFIAYVKANAALASITTFTGNIAHKELLSIYGSSSVLLLVLYGYKDAEGFLPGKLFEYLATGIPVLGIGPVNGDAANLLHQTNAGNIYEANDTTAIKNVLQKHFLEWKKAKPHLQRQTDNTQYTRRMITAELIKLL
jgi:glycosyltransferase involved in cell wall biosynthesis